MISIDLTQELEDSISCQKSPAFRRLKKDLSLLARDSQLQKCLQFQSKAKIQYKQQQSLIEVNFRYFPYNKDGKSLSRQYYLNIIVRVKQNYPQSPPQLLIKSKYQNPSNTASYQLINNQTNKYIELQWQKYTSKLLFIFHFLYSLISQHFLSLVSLPFDIQLNNIQQLTSNIASSGLLSSLPNPIAITKRFKRRSLSAGLNSETKNLNRHFRSKLRQILRDNQANDPTGVIKQVMVHFSPNRVGFQEIRQGLMFKQFNDILKREMREGEFFRRIMTSSMKVDSKLLMMKYYPVMEEAINDPKKFYRWKY